MLKSKVYHTDLSSHPAPAMSPPHAEGIQEVPIGAPLSPSSIGDDPLNSPGVLTSDGTAHKDDGGTEIEGGKKSGNPLPPG